MATIDNTVKTTVELDSTQAQQEIVKLNDIAADTTKTLEERIEAKNKAVELQNNLAKKTVKQLESELNTLKKLGAEEKKIEQAIKKVNKAKIAETKLSIKGAKEQRKLSKALEDSKDSFKELDDATGGVINKFKVLLTNPIGLVIAAIAGAFKLLKEAVSRSGKASEIFEKISSKLTGVFNGLIAVLEPLVVFIGEKLLAALEDPVGAIKELGEALVQNIIKRFEGILLLGKAVSELFKGNFSEAAKIAADAVVQIATGVEDGIDKIVELAEEATEAYTNAAKATEDLANKEKRLLKNRQDLEKQQLISLRLAEEQRQIRDDVSRSFEERIAANKKLGEILDAQSKRELQIAQQNLNLARAEIEATGEKIENLEALGDAEIKLLEIQERITGQRSEQLVNEQALLKEKADFEESERIRKIEEALEEEARIKEEEQRAIEKRQRDLEASAEADELELERKRLKGEEDLLLQQSILDKRQEAELLNIDLTEQEKLNILEKYSLERLKLEEEEATASQKIADTVNSQKVQGAFTVASSISNIATTLFEDNKAVESAAIGINTVVSAANAFAKNVAAFPGPLGTITGIAASTAIVASGAKAIADVNSQKSPKGSFGGSRGSNSTSAVSVSNPVSTSAISNISETNGISGGSNIDSNIISNATRDASSNIQGSSSNNIQFSESRYNDFQNQVEFKEDKTTI